MSMTARATQEQTAEWQPCNPKDWVQGASPSAAADLLGTGVDSILDPMHLAPAQIAHRTVLLSLSSSTHGAQSFAPMRAALYGLCDSMLRPYCAATHRPFPLLETPTPSKAGPDARHKKVSNAILDAGSLAAPSHSTQSNVTKDCNPGALIERILSCNPALLIVCSDSPASLEPTYDAHGALAAGDVLPLISLSSKMSFSRASEKGIYAKGRSDESDETSNHRLLTHHERQLLGGRALLQLGLQRERNAQRDYELALLHKVATVEYLYLLGVWRNAMSGREVSPLEHVHDHLDLMTSLGWNKDKAGLHVALSLNILADQGKGSAGGLGGVSQFGCHLQELGGVLTYLGRTGLCRVMHLLCANSEHAQSPRAAAVLAALIYKLVLLREEYSES